jgi:multiple sugar transport system permease protein
VRMKRQEALQGLLCVIPVLLILLLIRGYPIIDTIEKSFTNWDGFSKTQFIGLNNYINMLKSKEFWVALSNNFIFLLHIPIKIILAMIFALLLYEETPLSKIFRNISFVPQLISTTIIGYLFCILFDFQGPINDCLKALGLGSLAIDWMGQRWSSMIVISICLIWTGVGYLSLIILGGLSSVDNSVFEAARIDGANYWQRLFHIVIPLLGRTIEYMIIMNVTWVFTGLFPLIFTMTRGGPGYDTSTIDYLIYQKAFVLGNQMGQASTLAVILTIVILVITIVQMKTSDKIDDWSD